MAEKNTHLIAPALIEAILAYLGVAAGPPNLALVEALVEAYTRTVPWESAFRIAKRTRISDTTACPRWPAEFWTDALTYGGGGTCFESNYAFFNLLQALGYEEGYLTINNMGQTTGCHTAIVLGLNGQRWLVDVGLPLYVPLPIDESGPTQRTSPFHTYTVSPDGVRRYQIKRTLHPQTNCFTLIDQPVPEPVYRAALAADYETTGFFLDRVIVCKVIAGQAWRFNSGDKPFRLESFQAGARTDHFLNGDPAPAIAKHFGMDLATLRTALNAIEG